VPATMAVRPRRGPLLLLLVEASEQKRATTAFRAQLAESEGHQGQFQVISHQSTTYGGVGTPIDGLGRHPP
jgi:hypothetical protein